MIQVLCGNNITRSTKVWDETTTTPRMVLEETGVNYTTNPTHLDGAPLQVGEMDKTFEQLGITAASGTKHYLLNVRKVDNA